MCTVCASVGGFRIQKGEGAQPGERGGGEESEGKRGSAIIVFFVLIIIIIIIYTYTHTYMYQYFKIQK